MKAEVYFTDGFKTGNLMSLGKNPPPHKIIGGYNTLDFTYDKVVW